MNEAGPACDVGSVRDKIEAGFVCQCRTEWMRRHNRAGGGRERESQCDGICSRYRWAHVIPPLLRSILFGNVHSALGSLFCVDVGSVSNVSDIHSASIFRDKVSRWSGYASID